MSTSRQMQKVDAEKSLIEYFVYIENNKLLYRQLYTKFSLKRVYKIICHDVTIVFMFMYTVYKEKKF